MRDQARRARNGEPILVTASVLRPEVQVFTRTPFRYQNGREPDVCVGAGWVHTLPVPVAQIAAEADLVFYMDSDDGRQAKAEAVKRQKEAARYPVAAPSRCLSRSAVRSRSLEPISGLRA
jgi:hypothetical protein